MSGTPSLRRRRLALAVAATVLTGLVVGARGPAGATGSPGTSASSGSGRSALIAGISFSGQLSTMGPRQLATALDDTVNVGAGWIREGLSWAAVQPVPAGPENWSGFDNVVAGANRRHLRLLVILGSTPAWDRPATCRQPTCAPERTAPFAAFAAAAVRRYAPLGVHAWEIWNEPNTLRFWRPGPDPAQYAALLRAAGSAIKGADPGATVVSGGLATVPTSRQSIDSRRFLSDVCATGALAQVDGIGVHPYSFPVPPSYAASWNGWSQMASTGVSIRSVLSSCGQGEKPLWITEYGAPTDGPGPAASPGNYHLALRPDHVTEPLQAQMATESVELAAAAPYVAALFWYTDQDSGVAPYSNQGFFGLEHRDGTPKQAWYAFRRALASGTAGG